MSLNLANCEKAKANTQNSQTATSKVLEQDNNSHNTTAATAINTSTNKKSSASTEENYTPNKKRKISLASEGKSSSFSHSSFLPPFLRNI